MSLKEIMLKQIDNFVILTTFEIFNKSNILIQDNFQSVSSVNLSSSKFAKI